MSSAWSDRLPRRRLLGLLLVPLLIPRPASATVPNRLRPLIREATGGRPPRPGRVRLSLPAPAESGNSVRLSVRVESPMTAKAHVKRIHIFAEKNPQPIIARFSLSPQTGRAEVSIRIRLAGTQRVVALAEMNDGSAWLASAHVVVTAAACGEGL